MANSNLKEAKAAKNDEFYTQFHDIEVEMNAYLEYDPNVFRGKTILLPCDDPEWSNFTRYFAAKFDELGLKKLISTSYAPDSKRYKIPYQPSLFEQDAPQFDKTKTSVNGKIFILEKDKSGDGRINIDDLEWEYLNCDGDFRSKEVTKLRDEADFIITNPPFSLFREFLAWIIEGGKRFAVIGNMNAITYKEVFPLIKNNQIWLGATGNGNDMVFGVPEGAKVDDKDRQKAARLGYVGNYTRLGNSCWFTSIEHGRRHQPLSLMSMADNLRKIRQLRKLFIVYFCIILLIINVLILIFRANVHLVNYYTFSKIGHVRPLYPVAFGDFIKHRFLESPHDRTFLVKHIKSAFIMKYFHNFSVPGHKHIYIGCIARVK